MGLRTLGACLGTLVLTLGAADARAGDGPRGGHAQPSSEARDEADRQFLAGTLPGALKQPMELTDEASVARVCDELLGPRRGPGLRGDAYKAPKRAELRDRQLAAVRRVYAATVPPGAFHAGTYRVEPGVLPLRVDRGLVTLDGALTLQIMRRGGAELVLDPETAERTARAIEDKKMALRITFRTDADESGHLPACFSPARSAAYVLRVVPLSYELLEAGSSKRVALASTSARRALERFVDPGRAELATSVAAEGGLDVDLLARALDAKRPELAECLRPIMTSAGGTGVLGFAATLRPNGALEAVEREVEAVEPPELGLCVEKTVVALAGPKSARSTRVHLSVSVERVPAEVSGAE